MSRPHDMDNTDNVGEDGNNDNSPSETKKKPTFLSNNFDNYLTMKNNNQTNDKKKHDGSTNKDQEWNHFTTPLDPTREPPLPLNYDDNSRSKSATPSLFSDLERSQTVDRFATIFMERIGNVMSSGKLTQAWQSSSSSGGSGYSSTFSWLLTDYSPDANNNTNQNHQSERIDPEDYAAERRLIKPHLTPMLWGSSCMILSLFSMRVGRWYQGRYVPRTLSSNYKTKISNMQSHASSNGQGKLHDIRHKQHPPTYNNNSTKTPFRQEFKNRLLSSLNTLPVDMALSMLFGISATVFLTRPHYLMKDLSNTPLLEGRSVLAEELCVPFRNEMEVVNGQVHTYTAPYDHGVDADDGVAVERRQVMPYADLWRDENLGDFESLRAIRDFCSNCRGREEVAKEIIVDEDDDDDDVGDVSEQELLEMYASSDLFRGDDNIDGEDKVE